MIALSSLCCQEKEEQRCFWYTPLLQSKDRSGRYFLLLFKTSWNCTVAGSRCVSGSLWDSFNSFICVLFVKHCLVLRDTESGKKCKKVSWEADVCWCICWQCECSLPPLPTKNWPWSAKINGSLYRSVVFAFCVKVAMPKQTQHKTRRQSTNTAFSVAPEIPVAFITNQLPLWMKRRKGRVEEGTSPSCLEQPQKKSRREKLRQVVNNGCC